MCLIRSSEMRVVSSPLMKMDPRSGRTSPIRSLSVVLLPEPEGPRITRVSPLSTWKDTPVRMGRPSIE